MYRVGCAGILVEDTFCGPLDRLPRPGELLATGPLRVFPGGCAANVGIDLAKQGIRAELAGCIGKDFSGDSLLQRLQAENVHCERVVRKRDQTTSRTIVLLVEGEDRRYLHEFGANRCFSIRQIDRQWIAELDVFYVGGLFVMPGIVMSELIDLLAFCRENGVTTVVDVVVPQDFQGEDDLGRLLPQVDYFLPNSDEAFRLTDLSEPLEQVRELTKLGARMAIVTDGTTGCVASDGKQLWQCGTFEMDAVDASGAGDAFAAGVIAGVLRGWKMPKTLQYASALGGSATRAIGTTAAVFNASEAEAFLATHELTVRSAAVDVDSHARAAT